jgi:hypothetical protein
MNQPHVKVSSNVNPNIPSGYVKVSSNDNPNIPSGYVKVSTLHT